MRYRSSSEMPTVDLARRGLPTGLAESIGGGATRLPQGVHSLVNHNTCNDAVQAPPVVAGYSMYSQAISFHLTMLTGLHIGPNYWPEGCSRPQLVGAERVRSNTRDNPALSA